MKANVIILCAAGVCTGTIATETPVLIMEKCVVAPKAPSFPLFKINIEGILVNEPEEKRRHSDRNGSKNKSRFNSYGRRAASPSKATLKQRNKKR